MEENESKALQVWIEKEKIDKSDPGSNYSEIYEQRFRLDPTSGFIRLQNEMKEALPSPGYYSLAEIISKTNNKLVITTNFDSLTEDALSISKDEKALVITHESLAKYIDVLAKRPTVIKLHRDLLLQPKSGKAEVKNLSEEWKSSLQKIMDIYVPIVIGYGGNDGSLMGFLKDVVSEDKIIYWCYKKGSPVKKQIKELLEKCRGFLIPIDNFDDTMQLFGEHFNCEFSEETIRKVTSERAEKLVNKYKDCIKSRRESLENKETRSDTESMAFDSYKSLSKRNISKLEKRITKKQESALDYNEIADEYFFQNDYNKAIKYYTKAIELDPDNAEYYNNRGASYNWINEYEKAVADHSKAIELEPDTAKYYSERGKNYDWLNEYEKANADYSKAIELEPDNVEYYSYLVRTLCRTGDFDKAFINLNEVMSLDNNSAIFYNIRGFIGLKKTKYDKVKCKSDVLDYFNKAIELNNNDSLTSRFYRDRAEYYLYSGEPDKAYDDLKKTFAINNRDGRLYFLMARYYEIKGNTKEYERCMAKMKECRFIPDNSDY